MSETPDQGEYEPGHQPPMSPAGGDESGSPSWGEQPADSAQPSGTDAGAGQGPGYGPGYGVQDPYNQGPGFGQQAAYGQGAPYGQPWDASAPPADLSAAGPAPILMSFAPAQKQNRLTVLIRLIMAIPAAFVLFFVLIAAYVVAFIGWWAALFTGQLPSWAFDFLTGTVRWTARVQAYTYLLTDQYPPFSLDDDPDYPVRLITRPTTLNRVAVFFRVILVLPAYVVAIAGVIGAGILSIVAWIIALVSGQVPDSLHQAFTALLRYYARFLGYWLMITPQYPADIYGDKAAAAAGVVAGTAAAGPEAGGTEFGGTAATDTAPIAGFGAPPAPAGPAGPWQLTLSGGARNLVTVALVVGALGWVANFTYSEIALNKGISTGNRVAADNNVTHDYKALGSVLSGFEAKTQACQQNLACVTALDGQVSRAFATFGQNLAGADVPSDFAGDVTTLTAANGKVQGDFNQLATAQSVSQYTSVAGRLSLQSDLDTWQTAFDKLHNELNKP
jgi:hypothetical protein